MRRAALAAALLLTLTAAPAEAERLASSVSRAEVSITSSFDGETLTFFGNIEPDAGASKSTVQGPYHIVVVVTGPLQTRIARRKDSLFGIWLNTRQVTFEAFPSFFHILSDAKLETITDPITLAQMQIMPEQQARLAARSDWWNAVVFGTELVRLMDESGYFGMHEQGVLFRSDSFYSAQLTLASDVPPGPYLAHTYLFKDGKVIAEKSDGFSVRKSGFERFLGIAAVEQPLLYGLCAVVLALFTGWLGGVVFRR